MLFQRRTFANADLVAQRFFVERFEFDKRSTRSIQNSQTERNSLSRNRSCRHGRFWRNQIGHFKSIRPRRNDRPIDRRSFVDRRDSKISFNSTDRISFLFSEFVRRTSENRSTFEQRHRFSGFTSDRFVFDRRSSVDGRLVYRRKSYFR